jgi:hypothetical protein
MGDASTDEQPAVAHSAKKMLARGKMRDLLLGAAATKDKRKAEEVGQCLA